MKEVFYEESARIQNQKSAKIKYNILKAFAIISWILFGVWLYISIMLFPLTTKLLFLRIIYVLIPALIFVALAIVLGKFKNTVYVDYDYTFISGEIRISKVIKEVKRRFFMKFSVSAIEMLGKYGSDTFNSYNKREGVKRIILTSNVTPGEEKDFYYMVVNQEEKKLLVLECTETFIVNVLKFTGKTIIEKDYK